MNPTDQQILASCKAFVEATDFERHKLWQSWADTDDTKSYKFNWQHLKGCMLIIDSKGKTRITVDIVLIGEYKYCFWDPASKIVDHYYIDAWFEKFFPNVTRTNPTNFSPQKSE